MSVSALVALRRRMKTALNAAGLNAFSTAPEAGAPPLAYVGPDEPYVTYEGASFGRAIAHNQVVLVASPGIYEARADELDQMITTALAAIKPHVGTSTVGRPGAITIQGQGDHLGVAISTETEIDMTEEFPDE